MFGIEANRVIKYVGDSLSVAIVAFLVFFWWNNFSAYYGNSWEVACFDGAITIWFTLTPVLIWNVMCNRMGFAYVFGPISTMLLVKKCLDIYIKRAPKDPALECVCSAACLRFIKFADIPINKTEN